MATGRRDRFRSSARGARIEIHREHMTFDDVRPIALALPGVEEYTSWGTPAFRVRGKLLARLREEGDILVLKTTFFAREELIAWRPEVFFLLPHYEGYPSVLVRLPAVDPETLRRLLVDAWKEMATKKMLADFEAASRD